MSTTDFISQMVEETLDRETDHGESILPFHQPDCFEVEAIYNPRKQCFMICAHNKFIEIPKNWGPFKNRIAKEFILSPNDDKEDFLAVASLFFNRQIECLKVQLIDTEMGIDNYTDKAA